MRVKRLSQRDEQILLHLKEFDFLTRDQLNRSFELGTKRNTNRVLQNLAPYLRNIREGYQSIYYLSKLGREYVDCDKIRKKGGHVQHAIMRNEFYIYYGYPSDWQNEIKVSDGQTSVIVDAMFTKNNLLNFLEVDRMQTMKENASKVRRFEELYKNGLLEQKLFYFPRIIWLTTTELRRKKLTELCKGLPKVKVFTYDEII